MTHKELEERIEAILPGASFETDLDGQIVIYTGLIYNQQTDEVEDFELPAD